MSRCKLRTPWPIHFKFRRVIGIDGLMVCIPYGEISIFHSRIMGLYSSNCRRFFVCHTVNWEPLDQFTSNFTQLLELIVLRSGFFLVKFRFFIQELWERKSTNIVWMLTTGVSCALGGPVYLSNLYNNVIIRGAYFFAKNIQFQAPFFFPCFCFFVCFLFYFFVCLLCFFLLVRFESLSSYVDSPHYSVHVHPTHNFRYILNVCPLTQWHLSVDSYSS